VIDVVLVVLHNKIVIIKIMSHTIIVIIPKDDIEDLKCRTEKYSIEINNTSHQATLHKQQAGGG